MIAASHRFGSYAALLQQFFTLRWAIYAIYWALAGAGLLYFTVARRRQRTAA